jgi:3-keto-disaccharide hydrolase
MRASSKSFLSIASLLLLTSSAAWAQRGNRPEVLTPQWQSLFNGKDLSGWRKVGNEKWVVEDGTIYGEGVTKEYGYLATEKDYQDFDLSLRFKCEADGNSGVYLHTKFKDDTPEITEGRQVEIDRVIGHHTGGIYGDGKGWVAWPAPELETVIRPYDWNDMLIQVEGNHYVVHLNGILILDFTYPSPGAKSGSIALQLHSGGEGRMRFKDIFVRDLTNGQ